MLYHHEAPDAVSPHNWERLYQALDELPIGETLVVQFNSDGKHWLDNAQQAVYRHNLTLPDGVTLSASKEAAALHISKSTERYL